MFRFRQADRPDASLAPKLTLTVTLAHRLQWLADNRANRIERFQRRIARVRVRIGARAAGVRACGPERVGGGIHRRAARHGAARAEAEFIEQRMIAAIVGGWVRRARVVQRAPASRAFVDIDCALFRERLASCVGAGCRGGIDGHEHPAAPHGFRIMRNFGRLVAAAEQHRKKAFDICQNAAGVRRLTGAGAKCRIVGRGRYGSRLEFDVGASETGRHQCAARDFGLVVGIEDTNNCVSHGCLPGWPGISCNALTDSSQFQIRHATRVPGRGWERDEAHHERSNSARRRRNRGCFYKGVEKSTLGRSPQPP